nr:AbiV family abortive infection protein [Halomonas desiderata]
MERAAHATYENGCALRDDALVLYEASRFARATALAVLAEEEFSKAFMLIICVGQDRWDSNIYKALTKHGDKQGISAAMREYAEWFVDNYKRVEAANRYSLVRRKPSMHPGDERMKEILETAKNTAKRPPKDKVKQRSFYVGIGKDGRATSIPGSGSQKQACEYLSECRVFQVITEVALGNYSNVSEFYNL